jgi:hypothetical protein
MLIYKRQIQIYGKCTQNFGQNIWRKEAVQRTKCRWEDNIRMDLREIGWEVWTGCCDSDQWQALVNMIMNV